MKRLAARYAIAGSAALLVATPTWVGLDGLGLGGAAAVVTTTAACSVVALILARRLACDLVASPFALAALVAIVIAGSFSLVRIAPFMADPSQQDASIVRDGFYEQHNCLTAYVRAAELAARAEANLYDPVHYFGDHEGDPRGRISVFGVDLFEYPPPFVALARAVVAITDDFQVIRASWFAVEALLVAGALCALAWWIRGREGLLVVALSPLLFAAVPVVTTLQIGNFQLAAYALVLLALIAFERGRAVAGGGLLAAAVLAKLFPGVIMIVLLARRRSRALAWTTAWMFVLTALALVVVGWAPFEAFVTYHLPRMMDGRAFPWLEDFNAAVAANHSVVGIIYKLRALGVDDMTPSVAGVFGWLYTIALVTYVYISARRPRADRLAETMWWLAVLQLGALRSPFCPDVYALVIPSWLAVLLALRARMPMRVVLAVLWIGVGAAVIELGVLRPMADGSRFALTGAAQLGGFALLAMVVRSRGASSCQRRS